MLRKLIENLEENVLVFSYLCTIPLLTAQVVARYVFNHSLAWSEELARYIFIWQVWLGSAYCVVKNRHIRIDVFTDKLPKNVYKVFEILVTIATIAFCVFMFSKGLQVANKIARLHQTSPALKLPMQYVYYCIPLSSGLMIIHYILHVVDLIRGKED